MKNKNNNFETKPTKTNKVKIPKFLVKLHNIINVNNNLYSSRIQVSKN